MRPIRCRPACLPPIPNARRSVCLCARVWENPLTGEVVDAASPAISSHAALAGAAAAPAGAAATLAGGILKAANLAALHADGSVTLEDGGRIEGVGTVMYCTGGWRGAETGRLRGSRGSVCLRGMGVMHAAS